METITKAPIRERLRGLVKKAVIFAASSLNPFGCGYAIRRNDQGEMVEAEVHDHTGKKMVGPADSPYAEVWDSEKHGGLIEWVDEGGVLPGARSGSNIRVNDREETLIHKHAGSSRIGPHEYVLGKPPQA